mmetsp:Transcript_7540/g.28332  ORF Transcript_7540/g.28332 Transcript_7540/m.28332 type:complete len:796 (-) Transcript_7540:17-2404(-)
MTAYVIPLPSSHFFSPSTLSLLSLHHSHSSNPISSHSLKPPQEFVVQQQNRDETNNNKDSIAAERVHVEAGWVCDYRSDASMDMSLFIVNILESSVYFWQIRPIESANSHDSWNRVSNVGDLYFEMMAECGLETSDDGEERDSESHSPPLIVKILNGPSALVQLQAHTSTYIMLYDSLDQQHVQYELKDLHFLYYDREGNTVYFQKRQNGDNARSASTSMDDNQEGSFPSTHQFPNFSIVKFNLHSLRLTESEYSMDWHCLKNKNIRFMTLDTYTQQTVMQNEQNRLFYFDDRGKCTKQIALDGQIKSACFLSNTFSVHHSVQDITLALSFHDSSDVVLYQMGTMKQLHKISMKENGAVLMVGEFIDDIISDQLLLLSSQNTEYKLWVRETLIENQLQYPESLQNPSTHNHLFSVARAMKTQQDEIRQQISQIETLLREKESMIEHERDLMTDLLFERQSIDKRDYDMVHGGLLIQNGTRVISEGFTSIEPMSSVLHFLEKRNEDHASFHLVHKSYNICADVLQMELCVRFINASPDEKIIVIPYCKSERSMEFNIYQERAVEETAVDSGRMDLKVIVNAKMPPYYGDPFTIDFIVAQHNTLTHRKLYRYLTHIEPSPAQKIQPLSQGHLVGAPWQMEVLIHCKRDQGLSLLEEAMQKIGMEKVASKASNVVVFEPKSQRRTLSLRCEVYFFQSHMLLRIETVQENAELVVSLLHLFRRTFPREIRMSPYSGTERLLTHVLRICKSMMEELDILEQKMSEKTFNVGDVKMSLFEKQSTTEHLYASFLSEAHQYLQ